ncbi:hypothetical protein AMTR_s00027p00235140 [Amborella trichopoda]|uniref:GST C-terminal domain-containing protein n=1 Tax=Amborella trichopoda TaxID=13333 RepID=W1PS08_AMBTC|nr:hypothetical protein AMTR_s00027p00235140 [Amborella trichopoda]
MRGPKLDFGPSSSKRRAETRHDKFRALPHLQLEAAVRTAHRTQGGEQEKAIKDVQEGLKILEEELKGKFFNGEKIGFFDVVACLIAFRLSVLREAAGLKFYDPEMLPALSSWAEEFTKAEVVKEVLPPRDELLATIKSRRP